MKPYLITNLMTYNLVELDQANEPFDPVNVVNLNEETARHILRLVAAQNTLTDTIQGLLEGGTDFTE